MYYICQLEERKNDFYLRISISRWMFPKKLPIQENAYLLIRFPRL